MILQELTLSGLAKLSSNFTSLASSFFFPFFAVMYRSGVLDLFKKLSRSLTKESMSRFVCF